MKAIKIIGSRRAKVMARVPMPELAGDCVLIKTMAVALNPTDWKHIDFISTKGATAGCDYSGIIEEIGSDVDPAHGLQVGDRVAGFNHGCKYIFPAWIPLLIPFRQWRKPLRWLLCRIYRRQSAYQHQVTRLDVLRRRCDSSRGDHHSCTRNVPAVEIAFAIADGFNHRGR